MRKMITVVALAAAGFSMPSFAQSSGSGVSGSAGLGIDLAGITTSVNANPYITRKGGGPIRGLLRWSSKGVSFITK